MSFSSSSQAFTELERVQQKYPSTFWSERCANPLAIGNWQEMALAFTAWSWMDMEPPPVASQVWKQLWDKALDWPVHDELVHIEQALVAWSEYPVWSTVRSMRLIRLMEHAQCRDWSTLMLTQDLQPQRFAYHLLHAVCLHPDEFPNIDLPVIWTTLLEHPGLRPAVKESLVSSLLGSSSQAWSRLVRDVPEHALNGQMPPAWMVRLKECIPHRTEWFETFEMLQKALGVDTVDRRVLAAQWELLLNKKQWDQQTKVYAMFDFEAATPGSFEQS